MINHLKVIGWLLLILVISVAFGVAVATAIWYSYQQGHLTDIILILVLLAVARQLYIMYFNRPIDCPDKEERIKKINDHYDQLIDLCLKDRTFLELRKNDLDYIDHLNMYRNEALKNPCKNTPKS